MRVLTQRVEQPPYWADRQPRQTKVLGAQLKRLALRVLTLLSMGSALTALIALKAVISLWHLHA